MTMRPRLTAVPAALAALALAVPAAGAHSLPPDRPDPQIANGTLQRGLDAARERWKAAHLGSYRYTLSVSCFCPPNAHLYVVRNGVPRKSAAGDRDLATVPRLFRLIQRNIDRGVADLTVTYAGRGVPRSIAVDGSRQIADDEVTYAISRFAARR
jgi:hypothetical protein